MVRLSKGPYFIVLALALLAFFGAWVRTYALTPSSACVYTLAEQNAAPADVLFVGTSRMGRGVDAGYMEKRLAAQYGRQVTVERISLSTSNVTQFRPVIKRYVEARGAPKLVFLQLIYNFKPEERRSADMPVNPPRNVAFAPLDELLQIQNEARLNDHETVLPRSLEAGYMSIPAMLLAKVEMTIVAALKYPAHRFLGRTTGCRGAEMHRHMNPTRLYNTIDDQVTFQPETEAGKKTRLANLKITQAYLPFAPLSPVRRFENQQMKAMIDQMEKGGSKVVLAYLPALGEREIAPEVLNEIKTAFPTTPLVHPMSLFAGEDGDKLAVSFVDTHHVNHYGALQFSRYFTARIAAELD
ncbi:MAG: hypothetical protein AAGF81_06330 [Pseudomonadota bacterium]